MKKTLIALTLISASLSLTGPFALGAELTKEQEAVLTEALIASETVAHYSSRCLIDYRIYRPLEAAGKPDCKAMHKAHEATVRLLQQAETMNIEGEHELIGEITYYLNQAGQDLKRINAIIEASK